MNWRSRDQMKVEVALTELARLKLTGGDLSIGDVDWTALRAISDTSEAESWSTIVEFEAVEVALQRSLPGESTARLRALAIYAMVQAWTNQTFV